MEGRMDGWTSWNSPCVLQDIGPLRPLPKRVIWTKEWWFLVADTQLNTLQCQSVGQLVGMLVGLSHFWISGGFCITVLLLPNRLRLSCYVSSLVFGGWCIDAIAWFTEKLMFYVVNTISKIPRNVFILIHINLGGFAEGSVSSQHEGSVSSQHVI